MDNEFINITKENIDKEHICCIIRTKSYNPGIEAKKNWLKDRLDEGHVFRKLNAKATVFVEYAPLEKAWVPISGDNYYYIYCLWVLGDFKGKGYGKKLIEYVIEDAKKNNKSGICMLGSVKQKHWLSDQAFAKKYGFEVVDETDNGYNLLALSFDGTKPYFNSSAKEETITDQGLVIYYHNQCPYIYENIESLKETCTNNNIPLLLRKIDTLDNAKKLPCVLNNYAIFYNGKFKTVNLVFPNDLAKIMK